MGSLIELDDHAVTPRSVLRRIVEHARVTSAAKGVVVVRIELPLRLWLLARLMVVDRTPVPQEREGDQQGRAPLT